jgi:hypothetical protein
MLNQKKEIDKGKYKYQAYAVALAINGQDIDEEVEYGDGEIEGVDTPVGYTDTAWLQG